MVARSDFWYDVLTIVHDAAMRTISVSDILAGLGPNNTASREQVCSIMHRLARAELVECVYKARGNSAYSITLKGVRAIRPHLVSIRGPHFDSPTPRTRPKVSQTTDRERIAAEQRERVIQLNRFQIGSLAWAAQALRPGCLDEARVDESVNIEHEDLEPC